MSTTLPYTNAHLVDDFYKGIDQAGPYYLVRYLFDDWSQSDAVVNSLLGYTQRIGGATVRTSPHQHPLSPNLFCVNARVVPASTPSLSGTGYPDFGHGSYVVEAEYRAYTPQSGLLYDPTGAGQIDTTTPILWCTQELDHDTEVVTFPNYSLQWLSDGKKTNAPAQTLICKTVMTLTFHRLPYMPTSLIRSLRGKTNNATFLGAAAGKVLFLGGKTVRDFNTDGTVTQRATLTFVERDHDWNDELRKPTVWDTLVDDVGNYRYSQGNLGSLIVL